MTSTEYDKLTEEEKRIKVAELDGWERNTSIYSIGLDGKWPWINTLHDFVPLYNDWDLPDYPEDLNAMHEAVTNLTLRQKIHYRNVLIGITGGMNWDSIDATARQRAKAFVLTMTQE